MGWETRGGAGRYYTRSVRRGDRVAREYIGAGQRGEAAAEADRRRRVDRAGRRDEIRVALRRHAAADAQVRALCDATEIAVRARLLLAGYHRHDRGAWRKRRARRD